MGILAAAGVLKAASEAAVSAAAASAAATSAVYAGVAESEEGGGSPVKAEYIGLGSW
ncbi:MAG: hypothetical protein ABJC87_15115 [Roseobacter sp.]